MKFRVDRDLTIEDGFLTGDGNHSHWLTFVPRWYRVSLWRQYLKTDPTMRQRATMTFTTATGKPVRVKVLQFRVDL